MGKMSKSVSFEYDTFDKVMRIAKKSFGGNFSAAMNWLIRSVMNPVEFNRYMAAYHYGMAENFREKVEVAREQLQEKPEKKEIYQNIYI